MGSESGFAVDLMQSARVPGELASQPRLVSLIHTGFDAIGDSLPRQVYLTLGRLARLSQQERPDGRQVMLKLTIPDVPDLYSREQRYCKIPPDKDHRTRLQPPNVSALIDPSTSSPV